MNVRRITREKTPALAEAVDPPRMDLVARKPIYLVNVEIEPGVLDDLAFDFFIEDLAGILVEPFRKSTHDPVAVFAGHREESRRSVFRQTSDQRVMWQLPCNLHIGYIKHSLERASAECHTELGSDRTLRAIAGDEVLTMDCLRLTGWISNVRGNSVLIVRETVHRCLPQHVFTVRLNEIVEHSLVLALLDNEHVRIRAYSPSERG